MPTSCGRGNCCVWFCCWLAAGGATPQVLSLLRTKGPALADARNQPVALRGVNVGGWLL